jgi:hypothetical protein
MTDIFKIAFPEILILILATVNIILTIFMFNRQGNEAKKADTDRIHRQKQYKDLESKIPISNITGKTAKLVVEDTKPEDVSTSGAVAGMVFVLLLFGVGGFFIYQKYRLQQSIISKNFSESDQNVASASLMRGRNSGSIGTNITM